MTLNKLLMSLRDQFPLIPNKILYGSSLSFESIQNPFLDHLAPLTPIGPTNLSLTVAPGRLLENLLWWPETEGAEERQQYTN